MEPLIIHRIDQDSDVASLEKTLAIGIRAALASADSVEEAVA